MMKRVIAAAVLVASAMSLSACYVAPPPGPYAARPGCAWVPGHYGVWGRWHPGHCA